MIEIFPAIDIIEGAVVRLQEGKFSQRTGYRFAPLAIAQQYATFGFRNLHLVDLDGARDGHVQATGLLADIVTSTSLRVDIGGGIRSDEDIERVLRAGAAKVNVGSIAVKDPSRLQHWISTYGPDKFIVAVDLRGEEVAVHGWQDSTSLSWQELIPRIMEMGINLFSVTAIHRDGMMAGADLELYLKIRSRFPEIRLIASGGVTSVHEILEMEQAGLYGVILGKALLEGTIQPDELKEFL